MFYGYSIKTVNEYGLSEMKEVTFSCSPGVLREIGQFLIAMADSMENGDFRNSHIHIGSAVKDWRKRFPDKDIVVTLPEDKMRDHMANLPRVL